MPLIDHALEMERSGQQVEEWKAAEHRRRLAEGPQQAREADRRRQAEARAQLEALIPRDDALDFEETELDPTELARHAAALEREGRQMAADTITRRAVLIAYDRHLSQEEGLAWAKWEAGVGPMPDAAVADDADDDPLLDELAFDANGNATVVRRSRSRREAMQAGPTHEPTQPASSAQTAGPTPPLSARGRCSVCRSGKATQIAQALASGTSVRRAAADHQLSEAALRRHLRHEQS